MVEREERKREIDRRDDRDSHYRRRHSRREREPSPKKLRRDRERDEKRNQDLGSAVPSDRDLKHGNKSRGSERSRDVKNVEAKRSIDGVKDSSEAKINGASDASRPQSDPKEFARSKIFFQHDDRGSSAQVVQIHIRHDDEDNIRSDLKECKSGEKSKGKTEIEAKHATKEKDDLQRGNDGFFQLDSDLPSAKKMPPEPELGLKKPNKEHKSSNLAKHDERKPDTRQDDRFARMDDRVGIRENLSRSSRNDRFGRREGGFGRGNGNGNAARRNDYRDRFRGWGPPRGQERFHDVGFVDGNRRQQMSGFQTEKWKHDKYEEANQSPTNEEEQIAKVEALLAL